mgnify:CR=1 FL=1
MHPHIAHIYELLHDDDNFYIVQEIVRTGDLFKFLDLRNRTKGRLTENEVRILSKQLFAALDYMHKQNIVHRDIKLENILIDSRNDGILVKLTDFGFSTFKPQGGKLNKGVGSRYYIAPEILKKHSYDEKIDVWSATVVVYILSLIHISEPTRPY